MQEPVGGVSYLASSVIPASSLASDVTNAVHVRSTSAFLPLVLSAAAVDCPCIN